MKRCSLGSVQTLLFIPLHSDILTGGFVVQTCELLLALPILQPPTLHHTAFSHTILKFKALVSS
uniref:Uncharacterized protein n=1 Tax=Anguilla anguilla TaxID=7936 RepID=A0A0E9PYC0_ANGAN